MKQKSGWKIRPADQWTHSVCKAQWHHRRSPGNRGVGQTRFTAQAPLWALAALTATNSKDCKSKHQWRCALAWALARPSPLQPNSAKSWLLAHREAWCSFFPLNSVSANGTKAPVVQRNIHRWFTSRIRNLSASACQLCVYNTEATKHRGNYLVMNNL